MTKKGFPPNFPPSSAPQNREVGSLFVTSSAPNLNLNLNLNFKYEKGVTISFSSYLFRLNGRSRCGGSNIEFGVRKLPKKAKAPRQKSEGEGW